MTDADLPPDLAALERELAGRPPVEPSAAFGPRLLAATRDALRHRPAVAAVPAVGWRVWASVAAALLIGINVSMSVANHTVWHLTGGVEPGQVAATADRLRALAPDLPEAELRRQALLARAGAGLPPVLDLFSSGERIRTIRERDRWDVR
jgi:hypothetical protein